METERVIVPEPVDIEHFAEHYSGTNKSLRLNQLASVVDSPSRKLEIYSRSLQNLVDCTLNTQLYIETYDLYAAIAASTSTKPALDKNQLWIENTNAKFGQKMVQLEQELKTHVSNLSKDAIRAGHKEIAKLFEERGDFANSIRSLTKSRDFCTTTQQVLETSIGLVEYALKAKLFPTASGMIVKLVASLDSQTAALHSKQQQRGNAQINDGTDYAAQEKMLNLARENVNIFIGLSKLASNNMEKAAEHFLRFTRDSSDNVFISPNDLALYITLTVLATCSRKQVKQHLIENSSVRGLLEHEPWLKQLISAIFESRFEEGLIILQKNMERQAADFYMADHLEDLHLMIQTQALLTYMKPYKCMSLERMAQAFGLSTSDLTALLIRLIQEGRCNARICLERGVIETRVLDERAEAFKEAEQRGEAVRRETGLIQLRMGLVREGILVQGAKPRTEETGPFGAVSSSTRMGVIAPSI